jgi:hypothetical protein
MIVFFVYSALRIDFFIVISKRERSIAEGSYYCLYGQISCLGQDDQVVGREGGKRQIKSPYSF